MQLFLLTHWKIITLLHKGIRKNQHSGMITKTAASSRGLRKWKMAYQFQTIWRLVEEICTCNSWKFHLALQLGEPVLEYYKKHLFEYIVFALSAFYDKQVFYYSLSCKVTFLFHDSRSTQILEFPAHVISTRRVERVTRKKEGRIKIGCRSENPHILRIQLLWQSPCLFPPVLSLSHFTDITWIQELGIKIHPLKNESKIECKVAPIDQICLPKSWHDATIR